MKTSTLKIRSILLLFVLVFSPQKGIIAKFNIQKKNRERVIKKLIVNYVKQNTHTSLDALLLLFGWKKKEIVSILKKNG